MWRSIFALFNGILRTENVNESFWVEIRPLCPSSRRERWSDMQKTTNFNGERNTWRCNNHVDYKLTTKTATSFSSRGNECDAPSSVFFQWFTHFLFCPSNKPFSFQEQHKNNIFILTYKHRGLVVNILASYSTSPEFKYRLWDCLSWLKSFLWFFGIRLPTRAGEFKGPVQKECYSILGGFRKRAKL